MWNAVKQAENTQSMHRLICCTIKLPRRLASEVHWQTTSLLESVSYLYISEWLHLLPISAQVLSTWDQEAMNWVKSTREGQSHYVQPGGVVFPLLTDNHQDGADQTAQLDLFLCLKMSGRDDCLRVYDTRQTKLLSKLNVRLMSDRHILYKKNKIKKKYCIIFPIYFLSVQQ